MENMFLGCKNFNQDISKWNVSNVNNMNRIFKDCINFNQDLSNWDIQLNCETKDMFESCPIQEEYRLKTMNINLENILITLDNKLKKEKNNEIKKISSISSDNNITLYDLKYDLKNEEIISIPIRNGKYCPDTKRKLQLLLQDERFFLNDIDPSFIADMESSYNDMDKNEENNKDKKEINRPRFLQ